MNKLLSEWNETKQLLDQIKAKELKLREKIIEQYPGDQGTSTYDGKDFQLKITRGVTRSVDDAELVTIWDKLTDLEKACIKYKPQLDAKLFDKLPQKNKLSRAVVIKPSLPTVKLEIYTNGTEDNDNKE